MENVNENDPDASNDKGINPRRSKPEPVFNLPYIIVVLAAILIGIHAVRTYVLSYQQDEMLVYFLAFIPASFGPTYTGMPFPMSGFWSPVTHALLHGSWFHLGMNLIWMLAFGTPVAQRFGAFRFVLFSMICAAVGALAHYLSAESPFIPIIGASGAVSGYMGAAARFALSGIGTRRKFDSRGSAMSLVESFQNRQFLIFFFLWMGFNYVFGSGLLDFTGEGTLIAWQAHIGGFLAGLLLFDLLDPVKRNRTA